MTASFREWESDPLFSAAEVVQDSADRMESIFRMLLHEQSLIHGDSSGPTLHTSIDYHRRDLVTAMETTKWQLEDFERAVDLSALSNWSPMREDIISRHKQFIRAIQAQISHVAQSVKDPSAGDVDQKSQLENLNEQDTDGLALFLSGGNFINQHAPYESENSSIMKRFLDSTSGFNDDVDEIIELKSEEMEDSKMNGVMHINSGFDFAKENKLRKVGSNYSSRFGIEPTTSLQEGPRDEVGRGENWDLEECDSNAKTGFSKSKMRGSHWLDILGFLEKLWSVHGSKMSRRFTKRRSVQRPSSSYLDISQANKGQNTWMGLTSGYGSCPGLCSNITRRMNSFSWLETCKGRFQRLQYSIQLNRSSVRLMSTMFIILIVVGILAFRIG